MTDMKPENSTSEISQEMAELTEPLLSPESTDLSSNHVEQQMANDVIIDIKEMIQDCEDGLLSPICCIYKVPPMIRDIKEDAYTPNVISIGPFHYNSERLKDMERHKKKFFKRFTEKAMISLDDLVCFVNHLEPTVRACYSENIKLTEREFVKLILVDAGFIIELFRGLHDIDEKDDRAKLSQLYLWDTVRMDLILLENQLPFFVINQIFNRAFPFDLRGDLPSFLELTYSFFALYNMQKLRPDPEVRIKHFTDLLRLFYLPKTKPGRYSFTEDGDDLLLYSAIELQEAGVKLKVSTSKCLLDLKFSRRVLEIPHILIDDDTEVYFRNLIAFEQYDYPHECYFTDYAFVLDRLISTNKDVDVFIHKKIIRNWLGHTNDVATLFNGLGKNILRQTFSHEYLDICKRLNDFYQDPWHKRKATLRSDYCKTPWQTVASIAGIILLILTVIQTVVSILQVALN